MVPKHRDDEGTPATVQLNFQDHRKVKSPFSKGEVDSIQKRFRGNVFKHSHLVMVCTTSQ